MFALLRLDELDRILTGLGFRKIKTETKKPMISPYSVEGTPIVLVTYVHPNVVDKKLKVQVSKEAVLGVWSDEGKKPITAWKGISDVQELKRWTKLGV